MTMLIDRPLNHRIAEPGAEPADPAGRLRATMAARVDPVQPAADLAALIAEAERLHAALGEAKAGLARLIAGLRRYRTQSKLVAETLRSLRQLKLAEAAD